MILRHSDIQQCLGNLRYSDNINPTPTSGPSSSKQGQELIKQPTKQAAEPVQALQREAKEDQQQKTLAMNSNEPTAIVVSSSNTDQFEAGQQLAPTRVAGVAEDNMKGSIVCTKQQETGSNKKGKQRWE